MMLIPPPMAAEYAARVLKKAIHTTLARIVMAAWIANIFVAACFAPAGGLRLSTTWV
jgi:hypothetical protein